MSKLGVISPKALKELVRNGGEYAILDIRDQGIYYDRHLLLASCLPIGRLELDLSRLVPRKTTAIILVDETVTDEIKNVAHQMEQMGYSDVEVLEGGLKNWEAHGYELYSGINVPSKAFGEFIEHSEDTPRISAQDLEKKIRENEDIVILDSRPMEEFNKISIPTGSNCPGGELVYRAFDIPKNPDTLFVVNCAGRTRSIIGAQSLINAKFPNKVVALKDGTMGWQLAGFTPNSGSTEHTPKPSLDAHIAAKRAAKEVFDKYRIQRINVDDLKKLQGDTSKTTYVLDVRTREEFLEGHLEGAHHAPGGQLVQATDEYMATRNAHVVLYDTDEVRASMTASWLKQMKWDHVYVLEGHENFLNKKQNDSIECEFPIITSFDLRNRNPNSNVVILDFSTSLQYREAHIEGAVWAMRSRAAEYKKLVSENATFILYSREPQLSVLAARDMKKVFKNPKIFLLFENESAWRAAGLEVATGFTNLSTTANDIWYKPYERSSSDTGAMQGYLDWEVNLVGQLKRDGDLVF